MTEALSLPAPKERVSAGARYLDKRLPGWANLIDLETLDLSDPCGCVLPQATGASSFASALGSLGLGAGHALSLGFDVLPPTSPRSLHESKTFYDELDVLWRAEIEARR